MNASDPPHDHAHDPARPAVPGAAAAPAAAPPRRGRGRYVVALLLLLFAGLGATAVPVRQGAATVVTRFGDPRRVLVEPGLAFKLPAPFERALEVDLRLRTTSSGLHDVGTQDGLRILVQAWVAWQVPAEPERIRLFLRAVRNEPSIAADQIRTFLGSALETATSGFRLDDLLSIDPERLKLAEYEARIRERLEAQLLAVYGIGVHQVGVERLTLSPATVLSTVDRMKSERNTVAQEVMARGRKIAGEIRAEADQQARLVRAKAGEEAARIKADAQVTAAEIYGGAYQADPRMYEFVRSLEVLDQILHDGVTLILKTDAAPFRVLVEGPEMLRRLMAPPAEQGAPPDEARRDGAGGGPGGGGS